MKMNKKAILALLLLIILAIIVQSAFNITITHSTRKIPLWGILWSVRIRPKDIWDIGTRSGRLTILYGHRELTLMVSWGMK